MTLAFIIKSGSTSLISNDFWLMCPQNSYHYQSKLVYSCTKPDQVREVLHKSETEVFRDKPDGNVKRRWRSEAPLQRSFQFLIFFKSLFYALNGEAKFPGMNSKKLSFEIVLYFLFLVFWFQFFLIKREWFFSLWAEDCKL